MIEITKLTALRAVGALISRAATYRANAENAEATGNPGLAVTWRSQEEMVEKTIKEILEAMEV